MKRSVTFAVVLALAGCADEPSTTAPPAAPQRVTIDTAAGAFTGSAVCAECHAEIHARWAGSRHRSLVAATPEALSPWSEASLGEGYRVEPDGRVRGPGHETVAVSARAAWIVGGRLRRDLWVRLDDGRLQVFPYSVDLGEGGRVYEHLAHLSGGHSPPPDSVDYWTRIGRNADLSCYGCHATGARLVAGEGEGGVTLRSEWAEAGVGCEACHGPGEAHVASAESGEPAVPMPGDPAASCAACHGIHELWSSPFDSEPAHVAGAPVETFADPALKRSVDFEFRHPFFSDLRPRTYKQASTALAQSRCAREGGLTCAHCHDSHGGALAEGGDENRECLPCHADVADDAAVHSRHPAGSAGTRCTGCHMAPILAGPVATTAHDHSLAPTFAPPGTIPLACLGCHPADGAEGARVLQQWGSWTLTSAEVQRRTDIANAVLSAEQPERGAAARLTALALDDDEADGIRFAAAKLLATRLARLPLPATAERLEGLLRHDRPSALRRAGIRALARSGAEDAVERLRRFVDDDDPRVAVAALSALVDLGEPLERELQRRVTDPALVGDPRAVLLAGKALLARQRWGEAADTLQRAIDLYPFNVHAWNDLGLARLGQGAVEEARACWRQAIEINPRFEPARANLAAAAETLAPSEP